MNFSLYVEPRSRHGVTSAGDFIRILPNLSPGGYSGEVTDFISSARSEDEIKKHPSNCVMNFVCNPFRVGLIRVKFENSVDFVIYEADTLSLSPVLDITFIVK